MQRPFDVPSFKYLAFRLGGVDDRGEEEPRFGSRAFTNPENYRPPNTTEAGNL